MAVLPLGMGHAHVSGVCDVFEGLERHDRATTGKGCASLSANFWLARPCHHRHGPC